jgi:endonuclease/exonuclease/phosphatase family metal-dependent hydrolase
MRQVAVLMRVVSLNIRNGDAEDGVHSWPNRESPLISLLARLDADIYCLQEVMVYQLDSILQGLPECDFVGVGRLDGKSEGEFAPILYRRSTFQIVSTDSFWLSESPTAPGSKSWGAACERLCTTSVLLSKKQKFLVANTHLDHVSRLARERGIDLILRTMNRYDFAIRFLVGDLNAEPNSSIHRAIGAAGLRDSQEGNEEPTFHDFGRIDGARIDFIYSSGLQLLGSWIAPAVIEDKYATDHHAVVADFED